MLHFARYLLEGGVLESTHARAARCVSRRRKTQRLRPLGKNRVKRFIHTKRALAVVNGSCAEMSRRYTRGRDLKHLQQMCEFTRIKPLVT